MTKNAKASPPTIMEYIWDTVQNRS